MEKSVTRDAGCSSKSRDERKSEDFPAFNEIEESDDDNPQNLSDSFDDLPVSDDDDVQLSSPSNSMNSDVDQRWYAFRGRWDVNVHNNNHIDLDNQLAANNPVPGAPQQPQEEEETDFLEMDFEPDTNSEIENEATIPNDPQIASNSNSFNFHPSLPLPQPPEFLLNSSPQKAVPVAIEPDIFLRPLGRNTGAKPKQTSTIVRPPKQSKQVTDGDNVFRISTLNNNHITSSSSLCQSSSIFGTTSRSDEIYNLGASSSRASLLQNDRAFNETSSPSLNGFMKVHKSPAKSSSHNHHKHQRLHEEQNDQFLFEIEPLKPRNSVTIYTTNCDEKILVDALVSLGGGFIC